MSGYPDRSAVEGGVGADFESIAVLQKPFLLDTLASKIRGLLDEEG
jgi:hypothetical protein